MSRRGLFLAFLVVALMGCSSAVADPAPARAPAPAPRQTARSLASLVGAPVPGRNLYQLTDQLKLHSTVPIRKVVRTTSPNYPVGHTDVFHVLSEDTNKYFDMRARIVVETPHLYMYVQAGLKPSLSDLRRSAKTFENHTYPTDRSFFGSEWIPGVDGDPHITCLIGDLKSSITAGAFSAEDEYPTVVNPYSNAREMFYINSNAMSPGSGEFDQTLAHEFQHMIHFHVHPRDNSWMNEGMSMLAEHVNGYQLNGEDQAFIGNPTTQLDTWDTNPSSDNFPHYGAAYLFLSYIYDHFGRGMIRQLAADARYTDMALVNDVLHKRHIALSADDVFARWIVANWLDNLSASGGAYYYPELAKTLSTVKKEAASTFTLSEQLTPYTARYVQMSTLPQKAFRLSFAAPTTTQVYSFPWSGGFWWSNRGDLSDTRLIRDVDLSKVKAAHLTYKLWYEIEKDYDYGFIEASTDGGHTWTTLQGTHTTRENPFDASYGNGYTGQSGKWIDETVDLSRDAGKHIKLRFEYVTDDSVNFQGMAIRNIRIPEIGLHADFTGWKAEGFVPVLHNSMLNQWRVQMIEYTSHGPVVVRMPLAQAAQGSVTIDPAKLGLQKLVVAIFSNAPKTTASAPFTLTAGG